MGAPGRWGGASLTSPCPTSILLMTLTLPKLQSPHLQNSGADPEAKVGGGGVGFQLLQNLHEVRGHYPFPIHRIVSLCL